MTVQGIKPEKKPMKLKDSAGDNEEDLDLELYTTMHRVAAQEIHDMIKEYLVKKNIISPEAPASTTGVIHQTHNDPPAPR